MRAVALVVVAALISVAYAQTGYCQGWNITMNPGLQPTNQMNPSDTQVQICPFGFYSDVAQGGRCITFRQGINNYFGAPCYTNFDCTGSGSLPLACGRDKTCTWAGTRAKGDSCTDNVNCASYPALNGTTVQLGCSATTKTCDIYTYVVVGTNARCNYTSVNNEYFVCDNANTCKYYSTPTAQNPNFGAGYCTPLRAINENCIGKLPEQTFANLWCANSQACFGPNPANRTCQATRKEGETCYTYGTEYDCDQTGAERLYCNGVSRTCVKYSPTGTTCAGNYLSNSPSGNLCQMGLRCFTAPGQVTPSCQGPAAIGASCSIGGVGSGANCTTGNQCIIQPNRGQITYHCSAGANGDICQIYQSTPIPGVLTDSCQPGLFCQQFAPANHTCIPKLVIGAFCNSSSQCVDGISCVNSTCTAFQALGQPCNELNTQPLNYLRCNPSLQCSRGVCINNYTVPLNGYCSNDRDCENSHCDVYLRRCTRRKLCYSDAQCGAGNNCACSSGVENMGQCFLNNCGKPSKALRDCLNPLRYDLYSNATFYVDDFISPLERSYTTTTFAYFLDSGSSFYTKCAAQQADYVRCRGLMAKWAAPAVPLGDFVNYDLATISASSSVTVSFVAMIAFVMTVVMNL